MLPFKYRTNRMRCIEFRNISLSHIFSYDTDIYSYDKKNIPSFFRSKQLRFVLEIQYEISYQLNQ